MSKKRRQERGSIPNHERPCYSPPVSRIITQSHACLPHARGLLERPMAGTLHVAPSIPRVFPLYPSKNACHSSGLPSTSAVSFPLPHSMADSTLFRVGCQVGCFRDPPGSPIPSPLPVSRHPPIPSPAHPTREAWGVANGQYGGGGNHPIFQKIFLCMTFCM